MKYEFTGKTKRHRGRKVRQIRRLSDGVIGGWIESEKNLSHEGRCWITAHAVVAENARVTGDARVSGHAYVHGDAYVGHCAHVSGQSYVSGSVSLLQNSIVRDNAVVAGRVALMQDVTVSGHACIVGDILIRGHFGHSIIVTDRVAIETKATISASAGPIHLGGDIALSQPTIIAQGTFHHPSEIVYIRPSAGGMTMTVTPYGVGMVADCREHRYDWYSFDERTQQLTELQTRTALWAAEYNEWRPTLNLIIPQRWPRRPVTNNQPIRRHRIIKLR